MKVMLFTMLLIFGCTTKKYYAANDVSAEIHKNLSTLDTLTSHIAEDFSQKQYLLDLFFKESNTNEFIEIDLKGRLKSLEELKDVITSQAGQLKQTNLDLLSEAQKNKFISEDEKLFTTINSFSESQKFQVAKLFETKNMYKENSDNFVRFIILTRSKWPRATQIRD